MNARLTGWRRVWHDPVWSKVIAWGIGLALTGAAVSLFDWWPAIGQGLLTAWRFLWASSSLPNWLIAVLCLLALVAIVLVVGLVWSAVRSEPEPWKRYTSDEFFGLRWRWRWLSDGTLSSYRSVHGLGVGFRCENESCGAELVEFNEPYERLKDKVRRTSRRS